MRSICLGVATLMLAAVFTASCFGEALTSRTVWLEELDLSSMSSGWKTPQAAKSVSGRPMTLAGTVYEHGVGTHARSEFFVDLAGQAARFTAMAGLDDAVATRGLVSFEIWVDKRKALDVPLFQGGEPPRRVDIDLHGAQRLALVVDAAGPANTNNHFNWAQAKIELIDGATTLPRSIGPDLEAPFIARDTSPAPQIHGPRITGATPGRPFLFLIPATGAGSLHYAARGLPSGIVLDASTGILSGTLQTTGSSVVTLEVGNSLGTATRELTIVAGHDKLALTPPMGWNSWNCFACSISDEKMRETADLMVELGLAAHGYSYLCIDDVWQKERSQAGEIVPADKFPDMKALGDYLHSKGLKFGIYSSPGPRTCAEFVGSYLFEAQDARTFARWGVDYLKYDWCYYGKIAKDTSRPELQKPYLVMRKALDEVDRDIVYSVCQYGMGQVWEWGEEVGANLWRTTGDIIDTWGVMSSIGFAQHEKHPYAGPGHWNDPDMLTVGWVACTRPLHASLLTKNEQITHITLWSLLAAPLLIGCDLSKMDDFTLALLTNTEVIDVDQDPLGRQAWRHAKDGFGEVWARPLYDGTLAVGLFNRNVERAAVEARWADLGLSGEQRVRDLWLQKDLGSFGDAFCAEVPGHGAMLLKIGRAGEKARK